MAFDADREARCPGLGMRPDARYRTVEEARILEHLVCSGLAYEAREDRRAATAAAAAALERLAALGLPFERGPDGGRRFDPVEVHNFYRSLGVRGADPFWEERCVLTSRKLAGDFNHGLPASEPERFTARYRREYGLHACEPGATISLRVPLPLVDESLWDLHVSAVPPAGIDAEIAIGEGRLDARFAAPPAPSVTLGADLSFAAAPILRPLDDRPLDPAERSLYLRPHEDMLEVSPRVAALSAELAGSLRDPRRIAAAFWHFMLDRMMLGNLHYDQLAGPRPLDRVIDGGWYDCRMGSVLLAALCRARGIPARRCCGFALYPVSPFFHFWCEVWIEGSGWVPFDVSAWDLSAAGRDRDWRDYFVGYLDYRMKTELLPRRFTGLRTVRFPAVWHWLSRATPDGQEIGFFATDSGALVYREVLAVRRGPPAG